MEKYPHINLGLAQRTERTLGQGAYGLYMISGQCLHERDHLHVWESISERAKIDRTKEKWRSGPEFDGGSESGGIRA